jgi:hypothetical protein
MVSEGRGRGDQDYASVDHQPAAGDNVGKDQASYVGSLSILTTVVTKRFREEMSLTQNIARVRLGSKADISRLPSECPLSEIKRTLFLPVTVPINRGYAPPEKSDKPPETAIRPREL